ncbi:MAG: tRNA uridine-5-carboxymethylaminomethyl(34) synthesis enzyme MnmG [Clostridiales bacterium]|jgi:tRNA uridine 5-carboxymethylaminomethyl modification enzyme|nr:tRNA uridine-5-carboxymethylaminomethyl(34) synthesis enzyme MnmG [Clostridiales bacterium]
MLTDPDYNYDAIVVGIGHAGCEATLALARLGHKTLALSISLDNAGFLACNPSIGGTAKGHLVREVDALGGEMGKAADATLTHLRMLNASKGPAVQSLRAQVDKYAYHNYMKRALESQPNLFLRQGECKDVIIEGGRVIGVRTVTDLVYRAPAVALCCGVYMDAAILIGESVEQKGPAGFARSNYLADSLKNNGFILRRFKTGTPARVRKDSVDLDKLEAQSGEDTPYSFSALSRRVNKTGEVCYLGYTNPQTHAVIRENLTKSPKYGGRSFGTGARYCPSVEDKVVRFSDKERHQFFLEPEGAGTVEMYVQGLSTGLPADVQLRLYRTIAGFGRVEVMRDAYAIEYECIDPLQLDASLMSKSVRGLFFAGQINGTSGYEEAAAQGLVAGINASKFIKGEPPVILRRDNSYIGVLIDDLVTAGTDEPYRMMTSRAERRLILRQDNADLRLTETAVAAGLADGKRLKKYRAKLRGIARCEKLLDTVMGKTELEKYFSAVGEPPPKNAMTVREVLRRNLVTRQNFCAAFDIFKGVAPDALSHIFTEVKYGGYLERERRAAAEAKRLEDMAIPPNADYSALGGLSNEAKEKLAKIRPLTVGQASRIPGVTPADINVLIIRLHTAKK